MKHWTIGIVGGVGPYAGLDLNKKIFDQTIARKDQEHLNVVLVSLASSIPDRTDFLIGRTKENPAIEIFSICNKLEQIGADVVGISCNTVHSPKIFDVIIEKLKANGNKIKVVHMIKEVACFIKMNHPNMKKVGILCTNGTRETAVYTQYLNAAGLHVIYPDMDVQHHLVHYSIYDLDYGLKAKTKPATDIALNNLYQAAQHLISKGSEGIILGCTELPLVISEKKINDIIIIDPTVVIARALIRVVSPGKLRPLS